MKGKNGKRKRELDYVWGKSGEPGMYPCSR